MRVSRCIDRLELGNEESTCRNHDAEEATGSSDHERQLTTIVTHSKLDDYHNRTEECSVVDREDDCLTLIIDSIGNESNVIGQVSTPTQQKNGVRYIDTEDGPERDRCAADIVVVRYSILIYNMELSCERGDCSSKDREEHLYDENHKNDQRYLEIRDLNRSCNVRGEDAVDSIRLGNQ